jgi:broad specificity phosphatase PhoE
MIKILCFRENLSLLTCLAFIFAHVQNVKAFSGIGGCGTSRSSSRSFTRVKSLHRIGKSDEEISQNVDFEDNPISRRTAMQNTVAISAAAVAAASGPFSAVAYPGESNTNTLVDLECLTDLPPISENSIRIFFCRHGQTENNRLRIVQGARVDPPVNINGKAQATNLGLALTHADPKPEFFFCSPLLRAKMTAEIAASASSNDRLETDSSSRSSKYLVKPKQLAALAEIDFGPVADGQPISVVQEKMVQTYTKWAMGDVDFRPEGGGDNGREVRYRSKMTLDMSCSLRHSA